MVCLVCGVQVDEDVDGSNHDLGENEDDDNPLEELALCIVSRVLSRGYKGNSHVSL